jgi:hypothetical protein
MIYKVTLKIQEVETGISTETDVCLDVHRAESGFYIAGNADASPVCGAGASPRYAIIEWLGNMFYNTTTEREQSLT